MPQLKIVSTLPQNKTPSSSSTNSQPFWITNKHFKVLTWHSHWFKSSSPSLTHTRKVSSTWTTGVTRLRPSTLPTSWLSSLKIQSLRRSQTVTPSSNFSWTSVKRASKTESHIRSLKRLLMHWHQRGSKSRTFRDFGDSLRLLKAPTQLISISSESTLSRWTTREQAQWAHWTLWDNPMPLRCAQATRSQGPRFKQQLHRQANGITTW